MGTVLVRDGKAMTATPGWAIEERRRARAYAARMEEQDALATAAPQTNTAAPPYVAGIPWKDTTEQVVYRVVEAPVHLTPDDGWVTAPTIQKWYGVPRLLVLAWARRGYLDAAFEAGSPTKRYRVRDLASIQTELAELAAQAKAEKRKAAEAAKMEAETAPRGKKVRDGKR